MARRKAGKPLVRFVIVGQGRAGSKLLRQLLGSHRHIQCEGEVLRGHTWPKSIRRVTLPLISRHPVLYLSFRATRCHLLAYGCGVFVGHIASPETAVARLVAQGWRIIYLQRRDILAQTISVEVARVTQRWHRQSMSDRGDDQTISLDPDGFLRTLHQVERDRLRCRQVLAGVPCLELFYEDDLEFPSRWVQTSMRLLSFLGLPQMPLQAHLARTWDRPYTQLVANYAALAAMANHASDVTRS